MKKYDDIIGLPHHQSATHPHMSNLQRAAQFSAFAALRGFDEEIEETARFTEEGRELSEEKIAEIGEALSRIRERRGAEVFLTYFLPDLKKSGGAYFTKRGRVEKADEAGEYLLFSDGERIPFSEIVELEIISLPKS